jgi:Domain of unknown function (DUF4157)
MTVGPVPEAPAATPAARPAERAPAPEPAHTPEPSPARAAAPKALPTDVEDIATFGLRLGAELIQIPLEGAGITVTRNGVDVDVARYGIAIPGVRLTRLSLRLGADHLPSSGTLAGEIDAPYVRGNVELTVDANGNVSGSGRGTVDVEVLGRPVVTFAYEAGQWAGSVTVEARDIRLPIPNVTVDEGRITVSVRGEQVTGNLTTRFHHAALGNGNVAVDLTSTGVNGSGGFDLTMPLLAGSHGEVTVTDGKLAANVALQANNVRVPIPGLSLNQLTGNIALADGNVSGVFGLSAAYANLATLTLSDVAISGRGFAGARGAIDVTAPPIQGSHGTFVLDAQGRPSGSLTIASDRIPIPALRRGSITITLRPDGGVDVAGTGRVELGPVGGGDFTVSWTEGVLRIGADATINVPPLHPVVVRADYVDGQLAGEVTTGITIGPLSGDVLLRYREGVFSGEGRLAYALGRFNGWVLVRVDPQGVVSGEGEATFRLSDWLQGTIGLVVHPDLNVDAHGELVVPNDITLFDAWRFERNFFHFEQDFPLWGITIPVVGSIGLIASVHANAGFRASFGPGVLRNIRATGDVSTRPDTEPAFTISGDFNIPAGAEIVLIVGGGIGLAALIAKIEGGIDLNGIAGIYGAITLTPTFAYRNGQYSLKGEALLQAAAQLRASINAYARVVAGIGWLSGEVWRKDWQLAEWRFDTGWHVGLKAGIEYVLGQPFEPHIDFEQVDVDPTALIKAAVPNSGEPVPAPPSPPAPAAEFHAAEGEAGATVAPTGGGAGAPGGGGGASPPGAGGSAPPAPGTATAPGAAPTPGTATAPGAPAAPAAGVAVPQVDPPAAEQEGPEEREAEEQYLVYVYDTLHQFFQRKRAATAPSDRELRKRRTVRPPLPGDERSPGRPLAPSTQRRMESALDADLAGVRVHTDEVAREGARGVGAEAYAAGRDIYFGPSRDVADERLLAHELVHVVQNEAPPGEAVAAAHGEAEREAGDVADAVARGVKPEPVRKRREADVHRATGDPPVPSSGPAPATPGSPAAGPTGGAGPHVEFTKERLKELQKNPDPALAPLLAQLITEETADQRADEDVWEKGWKKRGPVDMPFPVSAALPHKGLYGDPQVIEGDIWFIHGESRETDIDTPQGKLGVLMTLSAAAGFTKSPSGLGTWDVDRQWPVYDERARHIDPNAARADKPTDQVLNNTVTDTATNTQPDNLLLSEKGFRLMWSLGWEYHGSTWWRVANVGGGASGAPTVDAEGTAVEAQKRLAADYQAHHVIPLWLRSESTPSGDIYRNLAPWRRDRHQVNHVVHHRVAEEIQKKTKKTSYLDFKAGRKFKISKFQGGTPSEPEPKVELDASNPNAWKATAGPPPWWGD